MFLDRNVIFGTAVACLLTCTGGVTTYVLIAEKHRKALERQGGLQAGALADPVVSSEEKINVLNKRLKELRAMNGRVRSESDSE